MSQAIHLELEVPDDLARLRLPAGVQQRLTELLDRQDTGTTLTDAERHEAEGQMNRPLALVALSVRSTVTIATLYIRELIGALP
jgi:hypothetical protein